MTASLLPGEERIEHRVLGALRLVNSVTGAPIDRPLRVEGIGVTIVRNRSGLYVLRAAPGFVDYVFAFDPPPAPAPPPPGSDPPLVNLTVSDPSGEYLARTCALTLPRDLDPAKSATADSVFQPVETAMYPSPAASVRPSWANIRATVQREGTNAPLAGAMLRVSWLTHVARGLTDARGEALLPVAGIPVLMSNGGAGAVLVSEVDADLQAIFDPASSGSPDPDALEKKRAALPNKTTRVKLASGRTLIASFAIALP